ncbi:hypothetical protein [Roseibacillus persicicus]|uniref:DUF3221 domain-containing protein n=1 Tax=Roseibacillus persicicus TaxID=454148 RepID=A0A918TSW6_9BACT|nr:hypothetical protein [Roseibacillus persicicus]MDQ8190621.1 hypothetical protein [Roseibacillus persicicus]GHC61482.1 hypothetical protein GCM10007100_31020 [Roseibacillus persicicus]
MRIILLLVTGLVLLTSCGLSKKDEEEKAKPSQTVVIGEITSVHSEQGFALFRRYGPGDLVEGGLLSARSLDGKRGVNLTLSPEKLGRFYTVDFDKEAAPPRVGDLVVLTKLPDDTKNSPILEKSSDSDASTFEKVTSYSEPENL